jgi:hypothetical protein
MIHLNNSPSGGMTQNSISGGLYKIPFFPSGTVDEEIWIKKYH